MNLQRMVEASKVTSFGAILAFEPLSNALASMMWDYCNDFRDIENWDVVDSTKQVEVRRRLGTFKAAKKCNFGQITLMAKMKGFFKLFGLGRKF